MILIHLEVLCLLDPVRVSFQSIQVWTFCDLDCWVHDGKADWEEE